MRIAGGPTVKCPVCRATGSVPPGALFGRQDCGLCEGRAYLFRDPHSCLACGGRGRRRERGHFWQTPCKVCRGMGFTKRPVHACRLCNSPQSSSWSGVLRRAGCTACGGAQFVEGDQAHCIVCQGKGKLGVPSSRALGAAAVMGGAVGCALGAPGAALGASGGMYMAMRSVRDCHGCRGSSMRVGMQFACPRCQTTGVCATAGSATAGTCLLCAGCGVVTFPTAACPRCSGEGVRPPSCTCPSGHTMPSLVYNPQPRATRKRRKRFTVVTRAW